MSESDAFNTSPQSELALRSVAMPMFANPHGDIFGGWLLSQMDVAGGTVASRRAKGRVVTIAITAMTFHRRVFVGDEVSCYAQVVKTGRTSIAVKIKAFARRGRGGPEIEVTEGLFTYVAVDSAGQPCPVPPDETSDFPC
jgi:acyl-CoA thioesterase YciA